MKALSITSPGQCALTDLHKPTPGTGEVLVQLAFVGFCGSDLSTYLGKNPMVSYPRVPGHELGGTIVETGEGVSAQYSVGTQVTVVPYTCCGECASCRRGRVNACEFNQTLGVQRDGGMTEYVVVPEDKLIHADGLSVKELAMVEPLTVGFHAVARAAVHSDDVVLVFGCGMIGLGAIAGAVAERATVIAVDVADNKLSLARTLGATHTINSKTENLLDRVNELTTGYGADVVIEAVGAPATYRAAVDVVAYAGRVACIGYAKDDVAFATKLFVAKEIDIRGSRNATADDFDKVVSYLQRGSFPIDIVVSQCVSLDEAGIALQNWAEDPSQITKILVQL